MNVCCSFPGRIRLSSVSESTFLQLQIRSEHHANQIYALKISLNRRNRRCLVLFDSSQASVSEILRILTGDHQVLETMGCSQALQKCVVSPSKYPLDVYKIVGKNLMFFLFNRLLIPPFLRPVWALIFMAPHLVAAIKSLAKRNFDMDVLDALSLILSFAYGDFNTVNSVNFLIDTNEELSTHAQKKALERHEQNSNFGCGTLWLREGCHEIEVAVCKVTEGDLVVARTGSQVVIDGTVAEGQALVNEYLVTGSREPVRKKQGAEIFAGSFIEDGAITILSSGTSAESRLARLNHKAWATQKSDISSQNRAVQIAHKIAPLPFLAALLVFTLTKNIRYASTVLMVDYSGALKLAVPIGLRSATRDTSGIGVALKSERSLEKLSQVDTVVLTVEGILTEAAPKLVDIHTLAGFDKDVILRNAACIEEHFPHRLAKAIVAKAEEMGLMHEETHTAVEYILSHGVAAKFENKKFIVGSAHFLEEDEGVDLSSVAVYAKKQKQLGRKLIYIAVEKELAAVFSLEDLIRNNVMTFVENLDRVGIRRTILLGNGPRETKRIADNLGIDEWYCHHTDEEQAGFVEKLQLRGNQVAFFGDGLRDAQTFSQAHIAVSMAHGGSIVSEACDVMLQNDDLMDFIELLSYSEKTIKRAHYTAAGLLASNSVVIALGLLRTVPSGYIGVLHNLITASACAVNSTKLPTSSRRHEV